MESLYFASLLSYNKTLFEKCYIFNIAFLPGPYECVDVEHTLSLLRKILEGVDYIHSRGIMHRDLKVSCINSFLSIFHTEFSRKPGLRVVHYQNSCY